MQVEALQCAQFVVLSYWAVVLLTLVVVLLLGSIGGRPVKVAPGLRASRQRDRRAGVSVSVDLRLVTVVLMARFGRVHTRLTPMLLTLLACVLLIVWWVLLLLRTCLTCCSVVLLKSRMLKEMWPMLVVWQLLKWLRLTAFGPVLSATLVVVVKGMRWLVFLRTCVTVLGGNRSGALLLKKMSLTCWFLVSGVLCVRLVSRVVMQLLIGSVLVVWREPKL